MYCPKCACDRPTQDDVVDNQPVTLCRVCGRRLAAGERLPYPQRIQGFTRNERYRPTGLDGVSRPKREYKHVAGFTLVELIVLLAATAIVVTAAEQLHWI
jgi:hypothetical protein